MATINNPAATITTNVIYVPCSPTTYAQLPTNVPAGTRAFVTDAAGYGSVGATMASTGGGNGIYCVPVFYDPSQGWRQG